MSIPRYVVRFFGDRFQPLEQGVRLLPPVGLDQTGHHVDAVLFETVRLEKHLVRLPHAGAVTEVYLEPAPLRLADQTEKTIGPGFGHAPIHSVATDSSAPRYAVILSAIEREVQEKHVHSRFSENAEACALRSRDSTSAAHPFRRDVPRRGDAGHLPQRGFRRDVRVEPARRGRDQISGHRRTAHRGSRREDVRSRTAPGRGAFSTSARGSIPTTRSRPNPLAPAADGRGWKYPASRNA